MRFRRWRRRLRRRRQRTQVDIIEPTSLGFLGLVFVRLCASRPAQHELRVFGHFHHIELVYLFERLQKLLIFRRDFAQQKWLYVISVEYSRSIFNNCYLFCSLFIDYLISIFKAYLSRNVFLPATPVIASSELIK